MKKSNNLNDKLLTLYQNYRIFNRHLELNKFIAYPLSNVLIEAILRSCPYGNLDLAIMICRILSDDLIICKMA